MALTPEQRRAQKQLIGSIRSRGALLSKKDGLHWWRRDEDTEWRLGPSEVTDFLDALEIPYTVAVEMRVVGRLRRAGFGIHVAWDDRETVLRWMPSFQLLIDAIEGDGS